MCPNASFANRKPPRPSKPSFPPKSTPSFSENSFVNESFWCETYGISGVDAAQGMGAFAKTHALRSILANSRKRIRRSSGTANTSRGTANPSRGTANPSRGTASFSASPTCFTWFGVFPFACPAYLTSHPVVTHNASPNPVGVTFTEIWVSPSTADR